jgi:hypothetical protein
MVVRDGGYFGVMSAIDRVEKEGGRGELSSYALVCVCMRAGSFSLLFAAPAS